MSILRLSTLSLTLAIAAFSLGYVNPSFADKTGDKHNHGGDDGNGGGGDGITYTAELRGTFVIPPLTVVLESRDQVLRSGDAVTIERSASESESTWDTVFAFCGLLDFTVVDFTATAGKKGWTIERPGGVGVRFRNIGTFSSTRGDLDLRIDLIGDCAYSGGTDETCDPFPPAAGDTSEIPLTQYLIHARGQPGINSVCHGVRAFLGLESTLVITATAPAP